MLRCVTWALAAAALFSSPGIAAAQMLRNFPANALRGEMRIVQPPEVLLNGSPMRLAPGARIRDMANMLAMSGALIGLPLVVNYTLDTQSGILDVWVLTAAERARLPWPSTPAQAQSWLFNADAQTWSRP